MQYRVKLMMMMTLNLLLNEHGEFHHHVHKYKRDYYFGSWISTDHFKFGCDLLDVDDQFEILLFVLGCPLVRLIYLILEVRDSNRQLLPVSNIVHNVNSEVIIHNSYIYKRYHPFLMHESSFSCKVWGEQHPIACPNFHHGVKMWGQCGA